MYILVEVEKSYKQFSKIANVILSRLQGKLLRQLKNQYAHRLIIIAQTFCDVKVLRVLAKEV